MRRRNEMDVCSLLGMHTCLSVLATASSASPDTWLEKLTALALKTEPGILCVPASYQSQLSDIRGPQYNHICNHTHTLKHAHAQMHHPSPAGKLWIGFGCLQQPAAVQESTPAHAFSVVGSFLLQGNKVGGLQRINTSSGATEGWTELYSFWTLKIAPFCLTSLLFIKEISINAQLV